MGQSMVGKGEVPGPVKAPARQRFILESPVRIAEKLRNYALWAESTEPQQFLMRLYTEFGAPDPRPHFRLLVIAQNRRTGNDAVRLRQVLKASFDLPPSVQRRLWVTTVRALEEAERVDAPVWICGHDLTGLACHWAALPRQRRPQLLMKLTAKVPRRPLFPTFTSQS